MHYVIIYLIDGSINYLINNLMKEEFVTSICLTCGPGPWARPEGGAQGLGPTHVRKCCDELFFH